MFWATRFIVERKKKIFILICVLASAVHFSSIICLIMLALYNFRIKKYHYIVGLNLILISNIFPSSLSNALTGFIMFINPDMGGFLRYANEPLGFSVGLFAEFLMGGLLVFFYKYNNNEKVNFAYNVFVVGMFIRLFFTFGMSYMRLSFYFIVFMIIVIPEVIKKINRPANHYVAILVTFLMSIYFLYSVYMVGIGNSSEPNIQYDINFNILNENVF